MSRVFSLATVYRMVTNDLLRQFFERLGNPCWGMNWEDRPRRHVESIDQCMDYFEPKQRLKAEQVLRQVFELACPSGCIAIREAAQQSERGGFPRQWPEHANLYCQSLWCWLHMRHVFDQALVFHEVEKTTWWRKRDDLPQVEPGTEADTLEMLSAEVSDLLSREDGRGRRCTVEHCRRENGTDYFLCYPDDYLRSVLAHTKSGRLVSRTIRPTFEIIFAYKQAEGTLELHAKVSTALKLELEEAFARIVLSEYLGPRVPQQIYELDRLKEPGFAFQTDPADEVHVQLRRLRVLLPDQSHVVLEPKTPVGGSASEVIESYLNQHKASPETVKICQATLRFHFRNTTRRERGTMTFDISAPNTCNLRSQRPERVEIAEKHLKLWRIAK